MQHDRIRETVSEQDTIELNCKSEFLCKSKFHCPFKLRVRALRKYGWGTEDTIIIIDEKQESHRVFNLIRILAR